MPGLSPAPDLQTTADVMPVFATRWRMTERQADPAGPGGLLGYTDDDADEYDR